MAERIFVIQKHDGQIVRLRAARFESEWVNLGKAEGTAYRLKFYSEGEETPSTDIVVVVPYSVIPQDMLYDSLADSLIQPVLPASADAEVDFLNDSLFSEVEKQPFTPEQRRLVIEALQEAKRTIRETFQTTESQQAEVNQKIDYLTAKVAQLDKFNWKRLFVSTLVGISVDLSFGTVIPTALLTAFSEVLAHVVDKARTQLLDNDHDA